LVLFLHGVGLRAEAFAAQIEACVAHGYNVLAPDMLGHGHTSPCSVPTLADYTTPLLGLMDRPFVAVGHSMGAQMAIELAVRLPDLAAGVMALNGVYRRSESAVNAVTARAAMLDEKTTVDPRATLYRWFAQAQSPERAACERWLRSMDPRAYKSAYTAFARSDGPSAESLQTLKCPALFLTGTEEPNSTPLMSEHMAAAAPCGTAQTIPGAAHMMPMTHADAVSAALLTFLKACNFKGSKCTS
jgi:pimeloyl-ACP methyl ester carboxylesterase